MSSRNRMIGMDMWSVYGSLDNFLRMVKRKGWSVYEVSYHDDRITFYAPITSHNDILHAFEHIEYRKTSGMLGFLFRQLKKPSRMLCLILTIGIWYALSNTIFDVRLHGDKDETKDLIVNTMKEMGYITPFYNKDMQEMKALVKKRLENDIAWLEVSKEGSKYHIQFTTKEFATLEQLGHNELIAQKDGVIAYFELQHGEKQVAINDVVQKGDVLVSNVLVDSRNTNKEVYVKGKVFAYTWKEVHVEMKKDAVPKPFQFYQLLFEARREAAKELQSGEKIHKENILQFQDNAGTISIDIHYTLLEDISTPN